MKDTYLISVNKLDRKVMAGKEEVYLMAVYGSLKKTYFNAYRLASSEYIGAIKTAAKYTMLDIGGYPAVLADGETAIHCEVYKVRRRDFISIGQMEMGAGYEIKAIDTKYGKACLYLFAYPEEVKYATKVVGGNWKEPKRRRRIRGI